MGVGDEEVGSNGKKGETSGEVERGGIRSKTGEQKQTKDGELSGSFFYYVSKEHGYTYELRRGVRAALVWETEALRVLSMGRRASGEEREEASKSAMMSLRGVERRSRRESQLLAL